jgi:2-C-methyl-D-erythritol 4-phosphate cytidylyltransferase/2-C-methyl-D-erythritol 2,4-cyclodiphosphate synthase
LSTVALIVAAGSGSRHGGDVPKQYQNLSGKSLLRHAIEAFQSHPAIDLTRVVIGRNHLDWYRHAVGDLVLPPPIIGGATRQHSVRLGLEALADESPRTVLIHDAARPWRRCRWSTA